MEDILRRLHFSRAPSLRPFTFRSTLNRRATTAWIDLRLQAVFLRNPALYHQNQIKPSPFPKISFRCASRRGCRSLCPRKCLVFRKRREVPPHGVARHEPLYSEQLCGRRVARPLAALRVRFAQATRSLRDGRMCRRSKCLNRVALGPLRPLRGSRLRRSANLIARTRMVGLRNFLGSAFRFPWFSFFTSIHQLLNPLSDPRILPCARYRLSRHPTTIIERSSCLSSAYELPHSHNAHRFVCRRHGCNRVAFASRLYVNDYMYASLAGGFGHPDPRLSGIFLQPS